MKTNGVFSFLFIVLWALMADGMVNLKTRMRTTSSPMHSPYDASRAVDGRYGWNPLSNCFVSTLAPTAWWRGDIGQVARIVNIDIQFRGGTGRQNGYFLYVSNTSSWTNGRICYHDDDPDVIPDVVQNKTCELDGRYVMVVTHSDTSNAFVEICEIDVYGCPSHYYGEKCEFPCYCQQGCNVTSGICDTPECQPGWKGMRCDTKCGPHLFGANCSHVCHCRESGCNHITGLCDKAVCLPGYRGATCSQECSAGSFGVNCSRLCHCETSGCSHVTGKCKLPGCSRGWHGAACDEACGLGTFGEDCKQTCHCEIPGCNPFIGTCFEPGCEQGWSGNSCDEKNTTCGLGTFGEDCELICHCNIPGCDPFNGTCFEPGCEQGWSGNSCDEKNTNESVCPTGTFGDKCAFVCHCALPGCEPTNGTCIYEGCQEGWSGEACDKVCQVGTFGTRCNKTCNCRIPGCHHVTGMCDDVAAGCRDGWTGDACDRSVDTSVCPTGKFGDNCFFVCHCELPGCEPTNGTCIYEGCQEGWSGEACDKVCPVGTFGTRCNKTCNCRIPGCHHVTGMCDDVAAGCQDGWTGDACDRTVDMDTAVQTCLKTLQSCTDTRQTCSDAKDLITSMHKPTPMVCPNTDNLGTPILVLVVFSILLTLVGHTMMFMWIFRRYRCCRLIRSREEIYVVDGGIENKTYDDLSLHRNEELASTPT
ncbi:multiple epidermal growth factor-like domains protein 10 [Argopecten irradians]|uniref:multiple epidermal growth factor-like domains protein 10 n=1 Tax=Argopecten irradians TaxID=31199 RepID=UPI00371B7E97